MSDRSTVEKEERAVKNIIAAAKSIEVNIDNKLAHLNNTPRKMSKKEDISTVSVDVLEILNRIRYTLYYIKVAIKDMESLERHIEIKSPEEAKGRTRKDYENRLKILHKEIDRILANLELYLNYWRAIRETGKLPLNPWNRYSNSKISDTIRNIFHKETMVSRQLYSLVHQVSESLKK